MSSAQKMTGSDLYKEVIWIWQWDKSFNYSPSSCIRMLWSSIQAKVFSEGAYCSLFTLQEPTSDYSKRKTTEVGSSNSVTFIASWASAFFLQLTHDFT